MKRRFTALAVRHISLSHGLFSATGHARSSITATQSGSEEPHADMYRPSCTGYSKAAHLHFGHSSAALDARAEADPCVHEPLHAPHGPLLEGGLLLQFRTHSQSMMLARGEQRHSSHGPHSFITLQAHQSRAGCYGGVFCLPLPNTVVKITSRAALTSLFHVAPRKAGLGSWKMTVPFPGAWPAQRAHETGHRDYACCRHICEVRRR